MFHCDFTSLVKQWVIHYLDSYYASFFLALRSLISWVYLIMVIIAQLYCNPVCIY